jgi:5-methylcytosine-specific restriction endonuclease McrA
LRVDRDARSGRGGAERADDTKQCSACRERKPLSEFYKDRRNKRDARQGRCKACNNAAGAAWRASIGLERYARRRLALIEALGGRCAECGEDNASLLEFDHVDPETKEAGVSGLLISATLERIAKEALKCQLLCVDCHKRKTRVETYARMMARWIEEDKAAGRFDGLFRELPARVTKRPAGQP